jgi:hypothetical protein
MSRLLKTMEMQTELGGLPCDDRALSAGAINPLLRWRYILPPIGIEQHS